MKARDLFEAPMAPVEEPITKPAPAPVREPGPSTPAPTGPKPSRNPFRRKIPHTNPRPGPKACGTYEGRARAVVKEMLD